MNQDTFLYTIPQWIIFAAIISIVYGWVEKKKTFTLIGIGLGVILGIFAAYAIASGYFVFSQFLSPDEILSEELEEDVVRELPIQAKILPAYWMFVVSGILSIPAFIMELKSKKAARWLMVAFCLIALGGFFIIVGAVK
jgi:hypothetical protein